MQSTGRWIAVDAATRRAFAIQGKDSGSPLLRWLADRHGDPTGELERAGKIIHINERLDAAGYLAWYRCMNNDYPFLNYADDNARRTDAELMRAYASADAPPPPTTERLGERRALPQAQLGDGVPPPTIDIIAACLRVVAGITRLIPLAHSTAAHKTSPSGGGRHPTDVAVTFGTGWDSPWRGSWWYDPADHTLVAAPEFADPLPSGHAVEFVIASHVARAMWRYRDVRAFRPVVIDAGHVVETALALFEACGWQARWEPTPGFVTVGGTLDPVFGRVVAWPADDPLPRKGPAPPPSSANRDLDGVLRTNPFLSLSFGDDHVLAENHLASSPALRVSGAQIDALAWATPSSRRDRRSTLSDLCDATGAEPAAVEALAMAGLLLNAQHGDALWEGCRLWSRHDWYLSLLAHAEATTDLQPPRPARRPSISRTRADLANALAHRRTCRSMSGEPLAPEVITRVLGAGLAADGVRTVILSRYDTPLLPAGLHCLDGTIWVDAGLDSPTEDEVAAAAIGQPWARGFAIAVWLLPEPSDGAASWEDALIGCGRIAQRIALAAADLPRVGVFQSPAMVDGRLARLLGPYTSLDGAYLVGVGATAPVASTELLQFDPREVLVPGWNRA